MKKILISGASGLIGTALAKNLRDHGSRVVRLVRKKPSSQESEIFWNPSQGELGLSELEGFTTVIHLGGKNIASGRWSQKLKQDIRNSRIKSTQLLCKSLVQLSSPPKLVIAASAIGIYGSKSDDLVTEANNASNGFLADICIEWEGATEVLRERDIRVVNLRIGLVLSERGGALKLMLPAFKMGLGGILGDGNQIISWVALEDVVDIIKFVIHHDSMVGPINTVAPNPVTNREFTKTLGRVLRRPTFCTIPGFFLRLILKEMAEETLLASCNASPKKLLDGGYQFKFSHLEETFQSILRRKS